MPTARITTAASLPLPTLTGTSMPESLIFTDYRSRNKSQGVKDL
jgi:hypothetical protein